MPVVLLTRPWALASEVVPCTTTIITTIIIIITTIITREDLPRRWAGMSLHMEVPVAVVLAMRQDPFNQKVQLPFLLTCP